MKQPVARKLLAASRGTLLSRIVDFAVNETSCSKTARKPETKAGFRFSRALYRGGGRRAAFDSPYNNMTEMSVN